MESTSGVPSLVWQHYQAGGFFMHPITLCSFVSLAVILNKLVVLRRRGASLADLTSRVRKALLNGRLGDAVETCAKTRGPVAVTLKTGLLKHGAPREEIDTAMRSTALHEIGRLGSYVGVLGTITYVAPLLGFLGTVVGMLLAFGAVADQGLSNPSVVAHGVSVALYTTAWGLIVAAFTKPFHDFFVGRITAYARDIETASSILFETFSEMERMGTKA